MDMGCRDSRRSYQKQKSPVGERFDILQMDKLSNLISCLKNRSPQCMDNFIEFLSENGIIWKITPTQIVPGKTSTTYCRYCSKPFSFPSTHQLIHFYRIWTCSSCTPCPNARFICNRIMSMFTNEADRFMSLCVDDLINDDPYDLLYRIVSMVIKPLDD